MARINYKKAFDILLGSRSLWKERTDPEKKEIFKKLNNEAGFNYSLEDYKDEAIKELELKENEAILINGHGYLMKKGNLLSYQVLGLSLDDFKKKYLGASY